MAFTAVKTAKTSNDGSGSPERGVCKVCGDVAYHPRATYCAAHKPERADGVQEVKASNKNTLTVTPKVSEWNSFMARVFVILTTFFAYIVVRNARIIDPDDKFADELAMTENEAKAIARPFSRMIAGTSFNAKHGALIVNNEDLIDAAVAAYDWTRRFGEVTAEINNVVNNRNNTMRQQGPFQPAREPVNTNREGNNDGTSESFGEASEDRSGEPPRGVYAYPPYGA